MKLRHLSFFIYCCVLLNTNIFAQVSSDTTQPESKVDYLEQIYFSGLNKEGLLNKIDQVVQQFENKEVTAAIAKQYGFLAGIKNQANAAPKSCDVLELIAAGIFSLDANEAVKQEVHRPSSKTNTDVSGALSNISSIGTNLSGTSLSTYMLSNGKINTLGATGKVAGVTNSIGGALNTFQKGKELAKAFGIGSKDKECKDVPKKEIAIGPHILPLKQQSNVNNSAAVSSDSAVKGSLQTTLTIKNIAYKQVSAFITAIGKIEGISNVKTDNFNNNIANITVMHKLQPNELGDKILASNTGMKLDLTGMDEKKIFLTVTP